MPLPSIDKLLLEVPLYEKFAISENDGDYVFKLVYYIDTLDGFCPICRKDSTFRGRQILPEATLQSSRGVSKYSLKEYSDYKNTVGCSFSNWLNKIHNISLACTRNPAHLMQISFYFREEYLIKIGQYPSIADLSTLALAKYRKVLNPEKYKEFNRGVGLITHGVGIGAFTYLRRIFEYLIEEAHQKLVKNSAWDESIYLRSRMDEKINLLHTELPNFLVQNRKLYSILSLGIHELTEDDCLKYFPTVRLGVELILEEKLKDVVMSEKIRHAQKSLSDIHTDLSKK